MKKTIFILFIAFSGAMISCNSAGEEVKNEQAVTEAKTELTAETKAETKTETAHKNTDDGDIKPIYLTTSEFKEKVWDYENNPEAWVYNGELPCVVDFYADWCKPCKMVAPIMDDLADHYNGKLIVYKVNTDNERELASVFQVRSIPSILFAPMEGKPAMQPGALSKDQYMEIINDFILKENKTNNNKKES